MFWRKGKIPAGSDADKAFGLGSVPEGMILTLTSATWWGGDTGGEYLGLYLIPAGQPTVNATVDGDIGYAAILTGMKGGAQTAANPANGLQGSATTGGLVIIPGPCTLALVTTVTNAVAYKMVIVGVLEDMC